MFIQEAPQEAEEFQRLVIACAGTRWRHRPGTGELTDQERGPALPVQVAVAGAEAGCEGGYRPVVVIGVLADVERGQMEADRGHQQPGPRQAATGLEGASILAQGGLEHGQVVKEFQRGAVGAEPGVSCLQEALVDDCQTLAVGLAVLGALQYITVGHPVPVDECREPYRDLHDAGVHAQFGGQVLHFRDEDLQGCLPLLLHHGPGHFRRDVRVPVPVAAHP